MKKISTIVSFLLCTSAFGQNLISNSGFEEYTECPSGMNMSGQYFPVASWSTISHSADYYNACATIDAAGVPANASGYQAAFEGNAYVGFYAYNGLYNSIEFLNTSIPPLQVDTEYVMTINISRAGGNFYHYAVDGFGVYFYNGAQPADPLAVTPQVDYTHYGIITDSVNWVTLSDTFVAGAAYGNLVIGDFKNYQEVNEVFVGTNAGNRNAYYYIDGVSLVKKSQAHLLSASSVRREEARFYPNPMQTFATLTFANDNNSVHTLSIYDVVGHKVSEQLNITGSQARIERGDLATGVYYYELRDAGRAIVGRGKFAVE